MPLLLQAYFQAIHEWLCYIRLIQFASYYYGLMLFDEIMGAIVCCVSDLTK